MTAYINDVFFGHAFVGTLGTWGVSTIVLIEGLPDHIPLLIGVIALFKPFVGSVLVHNADEVLEGFLVNRLRAIARFVPGVVDLLREHLSCRLAAFLVVRDAKFGLPGLLRLVLGIRESLLPFPYIVLQGREERLLALQLLWR